MQVNIQRKTALCVTLQSYASMAKSYERRYFLEPPWCTCFTPMTWRLCTATMANIPPAVWSTLSPSIARTVVCPLTWSTREFMCHCYEKFCDVVAGDTGHMLVHVMSRSFSHLEFSNSLCLETFFLSLHSMFVIGLNLPILENDKFCIFSSGQILLHIPLLMQFNHFITQLPLASYWLKLPMKPWYQSIYDILLMKPSKSQACDSFTRNGYCWHVTLLPDFLELYQ